MFAERRFKLFPYSKNSVGVDSQNIRQVIHPKTASRMVFIFDEHGFSDSSKLQIISIEESGRRTCVLEVLASHVA